MPTRRYGTVLPGAGGFDSTSQTTGVEWNIQSVKAPDVWALGYHGEGRVVAGADTGVQWDHPALKSQYRGWDGHTVNHDYNWHDATPDHSPVPSTPTVMGRLRSARWLAMTGKATRSAWLQERNGLRAATWMPEATELLRGTRNASNF